MVNLTLGPDAPTAVAVAAVRAAADAGGLTGGRAERLGVLVGELVDEARSREAVDGEHDVSVSVEHRAGAVEVTVADRRLPLDPQEARHARSRRLAALGFADHLHLSSGGADGNLARCVVVLPAPGDLDGPGGPPGGEVLGNDAPRVSDDEAAALVVRPMTPDDAVGLTRCVYRCYGYSYLNPSMYVPARVRADLRSGIMHSVVAVTPEGEVVGHSAMTFERRGDRVPEGGKLVVDPRYRGHHLSERLAAVRSEEVHRLDLPGLWSECVTNHPYSQREVLSTGGFETGLLIGAQPARVHMEGLANVAAGRHTLLTMYVAAADPGPLTLHVPDRHAEHLAALVEVAGLSRTVVGPTGGAGAVAAARTAVHVGVDTGVGLAHLRVTRVGPDAVDRVAAELDGLDAFDLPVVHLDLPLADPAAAVAVERLESLGFSWGAWVPCFGERGDVVRLQRVRPGVADVDHVECARAEGESVRDHALAEWRRVHARG